VYIEEFETLDEALAKALQADCNKYETGIEIISIRVTKPRIPEQVRRNYEEVERQKTDLMVATQKQTVQLKEEETMRKRATIEAEKLAEVAKINAEREAAVAKIQAEKEAIVSAINLEMQTKQKEAEQIRQRIDNEMHKEKQEALADAQKYYVEKEAEANQAKLTPEYLAMVMFENLAKNTKIYYGESIPQMFLETFQGTNEVIAAATAQKKSTNDKLVK